MAEPGHADTTAPSVPRTPADVTFRPAVAADAPAVAELIGTTWAEFFAYSVTPADLKHYLTVTLAPTRIEEEITSANMRFIVAEAADAGAAPSIVGVAHLVLDTAEACLTLPAPVELRRIYVSSALHGRGIAEALIRAAETVGRAEARASMWLGVWEANPRAQRFYAKMGFATVGEHVFLVGESRRKDWVMEKRI